MTDIDSGSIAESYLSYHILPIVVLHLVHVDYTPIECDLFFGHLKPKELHLFTLLIFEQI